MGGKGSGRKRYVEVTDDGTPENPSLARSPLFAGLTDEARDELVEILVMRSGPVREGAVGKIEPDEGVEVISDRWGGGKYKVQGRNADGKPIKGAWDTIEIAGEPKFKSRAADLEYKRQLGEIGGVATAGTTAAAAAVPATPTSLDIVSILTKQADNARAEADQRRADQDAAHKRDIERLREEAKIREAERKADEERREKERREDERRERERDAERDKRDRQYADEARRRDQEWYTNMLKMQGGSGNSVDQLMAGVKLALDLREQSGGGDGGGIGETIANVIGSIVSNIGRQKADAPVGAVTPAVAATAASPKVLPAAHDKPDDVVLAGALGRVAKDAIIHLKAIGQDPKAVLAGMFDQLARVPAPAPAPAKPSEQQPQAVTQIPANGVAAHVHESHDISPETAGNVTSEANSGTP